MKRLRLGIAITVIAVSVVQLLALPIALAAEGSNSNISWSYTTAQDLKGGTIVSIKAGSSDAIEPSNTQNSARILGVVVEDENTLVAVDPDATKAQVATNGTAQVLVSNINGNIATGDRVVVSPLTGIGMKGVEDGYMIGRATANFSANSSSASSQRVTDKDGKEQTVAVGYLAIQLAPGFSGDSGGAESGLQRWVKSLTGRTVSMPRIITSIVIAVLTLATIVVLMYAAIYGSIISIGRNPLARKSIFRALLNVVWMAALAVSLAFVLIYMLLR